MADDSARLQVINISDPTHPRRVAGDNWAFDSVLGVAVREGKLFAAASSEGFFILEMQPFFSSISREGANHRLLWEGFGPARLQHATRLTNPDWQELPGYEGTNTAILPIESGPEFFRLVRP